MSPFRSVLPRYIARTLHRIPLARPQALRLYATEAPASGLSDGKLQLSLVLPHEVGKRSPFLISYCYRKTILTIWYHLQYYLLIIVLTMCAAMTSLVHTSFHTRYNATPSNRIP